MTLLDANILLYAHNPDVPQHEPVTKWLVELTRRQESVALSWLTLWAFLRISTNQRVSPKPLAPAKAWQLVHEWLEQPGMVLIHPGPRHAAILEELMREASAIGPHVTDAALAALAIEYGATLASTDRDFRRFPTLRWVNPLP